MTLLSAKWTVIGIIIAVIAVLTWYKWRSPSLSELTPIIFDIELTHLGS